MSGLLIAAVLVARSPAQNITLDGSLGGARGPLAGPHYMIPADAGQIRGKNLFHSFGRFSVQTGESATFTPPLNGTPIANILSRVTGGQRSEIHGLLRSEIPEANLFLLNPAGVVFGPEASLDVKGSFHASTADVIRFADGEAFYANPGAESILTVAPPAAFGFLRPQPAPLVVQGSSLGVRTGATLSLVGGDLTMTGGTLRTPGGATHMVSVAGPAEVPVSPQAMATAAGGAPHGTITLAQGAMIDTRGEAAEPAGHVELTGQRVAMTGGAQIDTSTAGAGPGGTVRLTATERITMEGRSGTGVESGVRSGTTGTGRAGDIVLAAPVVELRDGLITTGTAGAGDGGAITLEVGQLRLLEGGVIQSNVSSLTAGQGGTVQVTAREGVEISGRDQDNFSSSLLTSTVGRSAAGSVRVQAPMLTLADEGAIAASTLGSGRAGDIVLDVGRLTITGGARVESGTGGSGRGGTVQVNATEEIRVAGEGDLPSQISTQTQRAGRGGDIVLTAPRVVVTEGAQIGSFVRVRRSGPGGTIEIRAHYLELNAGASIAANSAGTAAATAGDIRITVTDALQMRDNSLITTATDQAAGGTVTLSAPRIELTNSRITTDVQAPDRLTAGGNIRLGGQITADNTIITAAELVRLEQSTITANTSAASGANIAVGAEVVRLHNSAIAANTDTGVGGNVSIGGTITPGDPLDILTTRGGIVVLDNSQITANAQQGQGGVIQITVEGLLVDAENSRITASAGLGGTPGQVNTDAISNVSNSLAPLPQTFMPATALLRERCAERLRGSQVSSFVLARRESMPVQPGDFLPSPLYQAEHERTATTGQISASPPDPPAHRATPGRARQAMTRREGRRGHGMSPIELDLSCAKLR
jgi:filamentous hemagglutinin family protein